MLFALITTVIVLVAVLVGLADRAGRPYREQRAAAEALRRRHAAPRKSRKWPRIGPESTEPH